jgi:hypothetical protein
VISPTDLGALSIENSWSIKENVKLIKTTRDSIGLDTEARNGPRMNNVCGGH